LEKNPTTNSRSDSRNEAETGLSKAKAVTAGSGNEYPMAKARETSEHHTVCGITGQCRPSVSDVRLDVLPTRDKFLACHALRGSILDIENSRGENAFSDKV